MTVTALVSGGKDSIYAAYLAETQGWPVDELVTLRPLDPESMLFHVPNLDLVALQAEAWGKAHRTVAVTGRTEADELRALDVAIGGSAGPVVAGAIESSYQWARLLRVADRHARRVYTPLWRRPPGAVVREEIAAGLEIRFVHLAAEGLPEEWLGGPLDLERVAELERRRADRPAVHVAGEGGEYETLVVDAPFFAAALSLDSTRVERSGAAVRLHVSSAHLKRKAVVAPRTPPI